MSNHVIIFKAERNASPNNAQVQQCRSDAEASAPRYLSRRETMIRLPLSSQLLGTIVAWPTQGSI